MYIYRTSISFSGSVEGCIIYQVYDEESEQDTQQHLDTIMTELLNRIIYLLVACKLKTATDISPMFKLVFGSKLNKFYKQYNLDESISFKQNTKFINFGKFLKEQTIKYPQKITLNV